MVHVLVSKPKHRVPRCLLVYVQTEILDLHVFDLQSYYGYSKLSECDWVRPKKNIFLNLGRTELQLCMRTMNNK